MLNSAKLEEKISRVGICWDVCLKIKKRAVLPVNHETTGVED